MQQGENSQRVWQIATVVLLVTYFTAGVFGRFPWKADEPYYFGVMWDMLQSGDWLVPRLVGQPFMEKPPLVYWLGAGFAQLLPAWPAHEASRIAVLLLVLTSVAAVYACACILARELGCFPVKQRASDRPGALPSATVYATLAILLIPGCLGFFDHIHKLTADLAQMTGALVALLGLVMIASIGTTDPARAHRRGIAEGVLVGTGAGIAFLAKGLLVPGILACTCLLALTIPSFRTRRALLAAASAVLALAPWILLWPSLLLAAAPDLFHEWFYTHNVGRFIGSTQLGGNVSLANKLKTVLIAAGPIVGLCAAMIVMFARRASSFTAARAPAHRCVAIYVASCVIVLGASAVLRDNYLLPLLPGLVLFGLPALYVYPSASRLKNVVDTTFGMLALGVLLMWLGLTTLGIPLVPEWVTARVEGILPIPFVIRFDYVALSIAACAVVAWWFSTRHESLRSALLAWCAGVAMIWALGVTLLLPWIDAARSYHAMFMEVKTQLRGRASCIATINLGESELALFHYVTGIEPTRGHLGVSGGGNADTPNPSAEHCDRLLVLSNRYSGPIEPCTRRWTLEWTGHRPADRRERFALYRLVRNERSPPERRQTLPFSAAKAPESPFASAGAASCPKHASLN